MSNSEFRMTREEALREFDPEALVTEEKETEDAAIRNHAAKTGEQER